MRQRRRRRLAGTARLISLEADVHEAREERAGSQNDRARCEPEADLGHDARHAIALEQQVVHRLLENMKLRLVLEPAAYGAPVQNAIGLRARGTNCRPLA